MCSQSTIRQQVLATALVAMLSTSFAQSPAPSTNGPEAKANFLYYVALFVDWPEPRGEAAPLMICVLGESPVAQALRQYEAQVVGGRTLGLRSVRAGDAARGCHVLFVPDADPRVVSASLAAVAGKPVLTVGEEDAFLDSGGMLRLTFDGARLRLDVELDPVEKAGITLSSRLLEQAATVTRGGHVVKP